jgi:hypothetical protein
MLIKTRVKSMNFTKKSSKKNIFRRNYVLSQTSANPRNENSRVDSEIYSYYIGQKEKKNLIKLRKKISEFYPKGVAFSKAVISPQKYRESFKSKEKSPIKIVNNLFVINNNKDTLKKVIPI